MTNKKQSEELDIMSAEDFAKEINKLREDFKANAENSAIKLINKILRDAKSRYQPLSLVNEISGRVLHDGLANMTSINAAVIRARELLVERGYRAEIKTKEEERNLMYYYTLNWEKKDDAV